MDFSLIIHDVRENAHNVKLHQRFSTGDDLPTEGHLAMSGVVAGHHNWGEGHYWQLVGRGQGSC